MTFYQYKFMYDILDNETAKKILLDLNGRAIKALELNGRWNFGTLENRFQKKFFFLNGPALYPPPPILIALPLREEIFLLRLP